MAIQINVSEGEGGRKDRDATRLGTRPLLLFGLFI